MLTLCTMPEHEFEIVGLVRGTGTVGDAAELLGLKAHCLDIRSRADVASIYRLWRLIRDGKFDLIHTHLPASNFLGRIVGRLQGTPVISTLHSAERRRRPDVALLERSTHRLAYCTTVVSDHVAEQIVRRWGHRRDRVEVIHNGVDVGRFSLSAGRRDIDFLFVGRLVKQKGLDRVIPALGEISRKAGSRLAVVGTGPERRSLGELADRSGAKIDWHPFTQEPELWFQRAKVCIVPSRSEGFGLVAAEAMASGCLVVHSGVDALPLVCGEFGRTLPANPRCWPQYLLELLAGYLPDSAAHDWIAKNFDKEVMIRRFGTLYESAANT